MSRTHRLNVSAGVASVAVASLLVAIKLWALTVTGALSVAASLTDSAIDLFASVVGLVGIFYAAKPPDSDHAFGHSAIEDLVALGHAGLVAASAGLIAWNALLRFGAPPPLGSEAEGIVVMVVSTCITLCLVIWQGYVVAATDSRIVAADRLQYISDMLPNIGAIIALAASRWFGAYWLDPVIALAACCVLLWNARRIGMRAWHALMDRSADSQQMSQIIRILDETPGILGYHDLRTRMAGTRIFIQVHIEMDGRMTLADAHAISAKLKRELLETLPNSDVIIHQDPA